MGLAVDVIGAKHEFIRDGLDALAVHAHDAVGFRAYRRRAPRLLEVSRNPALARFLLAAAESRLERYPSETEVWVDHWIGRRFCLWIDGVRRLAPDLLRNETPLRSRAVRLVTVLVNLCVAEAKLLEEVLVDGGGSPPLGRCVLSYELDI